LPELKREYLTSEELELLRQIRTSSRTQEIVKHKKEKWKDLPKVLDVDSPIFPEIDVEDGQKAKIGQTYSEWKRKKITALKMQEDGEEPIEVTIRASIWIWGVLRIKKLSRLPNGKYYSQCWVPKIYNEETKEWIPADEKDCENWESIPDDKKRVDLLMGVVPDD